MEDLYDSKNRSAEFYREQTWKLVLERMDEIQREQRSQRILIEKINQKWAYVYGIAFGVTVLISAAWQLILVKIKTLLP